MTYWHFRDNFHPIFVIFPILYSLFKILSKITQIFQGNRQIEKNKRFSLNAIFPFLNFFDSDKEAFHLNEFIIFLCKAIECERRFDLSEKLSRILIEYSL